MKRKSWFRKLLFSYLPLFFIVISFLITVFFYSMSEVTRKAAETVNHGSSEHTLEVIDQSLRSIERMMIKELMTSEGVKNFYNDLLRDEPYHRMVVPSEKLRGMFSQFPLIHSIYLVRWEDSVVLTAQSALPIERFEDREFIQSHLESGEGTRWTAMRPYRELSIQHTNDVVTLVKPYPLPAGNQGIMVVNVGSSALQSLVQDMFSSGFIDATLVDRNDKPLFARELNTLSGGKVMTEVQSDYTGWKIRSNVSAGSFYQFATTFNKVLLLSGAVAIVIAVLYIMYISKRNYRPLASLTERVHSYAQHKAERLLKAGGKDEFAFLENVLDEMIEQSNEFMTQQEEHLQVRKRQWVKETLEGDYDTVAGRAWPDVSERFGWDSARERSVVIVIEIDRYMEFCETYTKRDQSLLKYLLGNVAAEIAYQQGFLLFGEWLQAYRWCAFLQLKADQAGEDAAMFAQQVVAWIQANLDFNVTIGVGDTAGSPEEISTSYEQALHALQFKMTLGNNRVIAHWEVPDSGEGETRRSADIRELTHSFRLGEPEWEEHYGRFIDDLRTGLAPKEELMYRVDYLVYQLSREIQELNGDYQSVWLGDALPRLNRLFKTFESFEELDGGMLGILRDAHQRMSQLREDRTYSSTMMKARQYIAENYSNPDLSLNHLSTAFDLNPKYVSHLFKEEFGEKFVDYLANVRTEKAKELLAATTLSVQDIAMRVGYTHSFSFIRVFKKAVGMTPGDYRKQVKSG